MVESWVNQVISYDESVNKRRALQIGAIYLFDNEDGNPSNSYTDGATMHDVIWNEILSKNNFSRFRIFENDSLGMDEKPKTDRVLNSSNILTTLSENEFGMVNFLAHGTKTTVLRKRWRKDTNNNGRADNKSSSSEKEILIETLFSAEQISSIDINCGVVIGTACSTAYIATGIDSVATSFLRSGTAAYIGGSALNYFASGWKSKEDGGNQAISYNLTKYYVEGATLGWSLMSTLRDYYYQFSNISNTDYTLQNIYSFILLGDPTMKLDPPKSVKQIPLFLNPQSLKITSGEKSSFDIEIGDVNASGNLTLDITPNINGIDFILPSKILLPGDSFRIDIETSITLKPGDYEFKIKCWAEEYEGEETLRLKIIPPAQTTNVKLVPDYTLVTQNQEFWLDLIVEPTKPIDKLAGILSYNSNCFEFIGYRVGSIVTEDYRCPDSISIEDRPGYSDLVFSFDRNVDIYGITSTGVVLSFCFKGVCSTESGSQKFAVSSLDIESNKSDGRRKHSFSSLPHSLVNVRKIDPDISDFFIHTGIESNFEYDADLNISEDKLTLKVLQPSARFCM
ncbi:MAG: C25 family cysteine peptidase [Caldisericia bacterium]